MRVRTLSSLALVMFLSASATAMAQTGPAGRGPSAGQTLRDRRSEMRDRLKGMTPEERAAAKDKAKDRLDKLSDDQKAWIKSYRAEQKTIHDQVKAGTIDRKTAASQLKAWRDANPRPKKS